jgi:hypothetical protein
MCRKGRTLFGEGSVVTDVPVREGAGMKGIGEGRMAGDAACFYWVSHLAEVAVKRNAGDYREKSQMIPGRNIWDGDGGDLNRENGKAG